MNLYFFIKFIDGANINKSDFLNQASFEQNPIVERNSTIKPLRSKDKKKKKVVVVPER